LLRINEQQRGVRLCFFAGGPALPPCFSAKAVMVAASSVFSWNLAASAAGHYPAYPAAYQDLRDDTQRARSLRSVASVFAPALRVSVIACRQKFSGYCRLPASQKACWQVQPAPAARGAHKTQKKKTL
jgi:hypothetical protein